MKIERMYARGAEYQRFETLKRNREKRTRQKLAFMEGVQMVEQAIRHNWEFAAMAVADGRRLSGWAEDMIAKAKPEVLYQMEEGMHADLSDREESCEIIALVRERTKELKRRPPEAARRRCTRSLTGRRLRETWEPSFAPLTPLAERV